MKAHLTAAAIAAAFLTIPTNSAAQKAPDEGFVVSGIPEVRQWQDNVGRKLDNELAFQERIAGPGEMHTGIIQLRFRRGDDGKPQDISVYRSAASNAVKSSARHAVSRMRDLPPLPSTYAETNEVLVNIVLANSDSHLRELSRKLARWETERMALSAKERRVLAYNSIRR